MNAAGHSTRYRPESREPTHNCRLAGTSSLELVKCFAVAPRAIDNLVANLGRITPGNTTCGVLVLFPAPYIGAKELYYPACRRLGPDDEPARPISACRG